MFVFHNLYFFSLDIEKHTYYAIDCVDFLCKGINSLVQASFFSRRLKADTLGLFVFHVRYKHVHMHTRIVVHLSFISDQ